jgi:hypothetical protein
MGTPASCVHHPTRPAARSCARCGNFVCSGCLISGAICTECKALLNRQGIPYSDEEKARAVARRCFGAARRGVQGLFALGISMIGLSLLGASFGLGRLVPLGAMGLGTLGVILGLCVAGLSAFGLMRSQAGRPGPRVAGVFPPITGGFFILLGLTPLVLGIALLLS